MAERRRPRPRTLAVAFGAYTVVAIGAAYLLAPTIAGYVMPSATFWISAAYVVLGAGALLGICALGMRMARRLDMRIDGLLLRRRQARAAAVAPPGTPRPPPVTDSGSADHEVDQLMAELQRVSAVALAENPAMLEGAEAEMASEGFSALEALEMEQLKEVRDAVAITLVGPAVAAVALVGAFAPLLPAADGMLISDLQLNAFVGVAGVAVLAGVVAYAAASLRQLARRASA